MSQTTCRSGALSGERRYPGGSWHREWESLSVACPERVPRRSCRLEVTPCLVLHHVHDLKTSKLDFINLGG